MRLKTRFSRFYRLRSVSNKKSQFSLGMPLVIIIFIIFAGFLLFFVMGRLTDIKSLVREKELNNFALSLNNILKKQSMVSYGSIDEIILSLPEDINSVCFVDSSKEIDRFAKKGLSSRLILDETKNLFLSPIEKNPTFRLDNLELKESSPLCIKTKQGKISLKLTSTGKNSLVEAKDISDRDIDCVSVIYNGEPEDKIDIVFLGHGYEEVGEFARDINGYINNIFSITEPFKENMDKFNFFRIDRFSSLGCSIKGSGFQHFISCDEFSVKNVASECPNDYIFILVDRSKIKDIIQPVRSSAFSNLAKISTADKKFVLLHEFGHTFADLDDEYVDEGYYRDIDFSGSPNCDSFPCANWEDIEDTGCFKGCSINEFYRSSKESIMRNYYKSEEFGILNTRIIKSNIDKYE